MELLQGLRSQWIWEKGVTGDIAESSFSSSGVLARL